MNPHLLYAQAIKGASRAAASASSTRSIWSRSSAPPTALEARSVLSATDRDGVRNWFAVPDVDDDARVWNRGAGREEQSRHVLGDAGGRIRAVHRPHADLTEFCRTRYKTVLVPNHMAADGGFPRELGRPSPTVTRCSTSTRWRWCARSCRAGARTCGRSNCRTAAGCGRRWPSWRPTSPTRRRGRTSLTSIPRRLAGAPAVAAVRRPRARQARLSRAMADARSGSDGRRSHPKLLHPAARVVDELTKKSALICVHLRFDIFTAIPLV